MFDAHGHGLSEPNEDDARFSVSAFSHLVDDATQFLLEKVRPWHRDNCSHVPLFFGGVSMGALTVRLLLHSLHWSLSQRKSALTVLIVAGGNLCCI